MKNHKQDPLMWIIWTLGIIFGIKLIYHAIAHNSLFVGFIGAVCLVFCLAAMIFPEHDKSHNSNKK